MPALTLPLTFTNSFWSTDFRKGLETLFQKLEQGIAENDEIVEFLKARVMSENALANQLTNPIPTGSFGTGFSGDEGASLLMAFRGLQAESARQGEAHRALAKELDTMVVAPFDSWAQSHQARIAGARNSLIDGQLKAYELAQGDVEKLKHDYLTKVRKADEAEDDAKFAPSSKADNYTSSPRLHPRDTRNPQRTPSVSERIAARFKELQRKAAAQASDEKHDDEEDKASVVFDNSSPTSQTSAAAEEKPLPKVDKGKGKEVVIASPEATTPTGLASPPPMSPKLPPPKVDVQAPSPAPAEPILLAGLALPPTALSDLLKRAASQLRLRPIKFPIIGEYKDCFSGEEFVIWLVDNVDGLGGSLDRAEDAARDLTERDSLLRRVGEFGNAFENHDEAYYQFRPKAFELGSESSLKSPQHESVTSPIMANLSPVTDNLVKRSNTLVNIVSKVISASAEPRHIRARADAIDADKAYRVSVRKLDRQRLGVEERIEETLKIAQKWEMDRLQAVKTVMSQYQTALMHLPGDIKPSLERSATLIASFQPESDLRALIERYRTGPFMPAAHIYESITHDEDDAYFGIDLRKWADGGWNAVRNAEEPKEMVPDVLTVLLTVLKEKYPGLANDSEKRKTWIYEVPLSAVHHLREALNGIPPSDSIPFELVQQYDAPVIASAIKLWALELDPPLGLWEGWDDFRRLYPTVGGNAEEKPEEAQHFQELQSCLLRLPKIHLLVLQTIFGHLRDLIDSTSVEEDEDVFITKLALSLGRIILRPKQESQISIQDRHSTLLFFDLLKHYTEILPPTVARKKRESDRKMPIRKRTAPIDMRLSRSRLSVTLSPREQFEAQMTAKNPSMRPSSRAPSPAPPVPALPPTPGAVQSHGAEAPPETATLEAAPALPVVAPSQPEVTPAPIAEEIIIDVPSVSKPPSFKDPPPETDDDAPPRPSFAEPPPETDDDVVPPPMPAHFAEPPPETPDEAPPAASAPEEQVAPAESTVVVAPPTPRASSNSPARGAARSRSPTGSSTNSTTNGEGILSSTAGKSSSGANLSRSGSNEASRIRGPRGARGPRQGNTGNMPSITSGLKRASSPPTGVSNVSASGLSRTSASSNRLSYAGGGRSASPVNPHDFEPRGKKGGRANASAFSRRTMASDAEDEVVQK